jgi:hypothetical protein
MTRRSWTNTGQGTRQRQAAKQPDAPYRECNAGITKIKVQEGKGQPVAFVFSALSLARHNLFTMAAITAASGVVLLALLAIRRF